jgi:hypothetical protein
MVKTPDPIRPNNKSTQAHDTEAIPPTISPPTMSKLLKKSAKQGERPFLVAETILKRLN